MSKTPRSSRTMKIKVSILSFLNTASFNSYTSLFYFKSNFSVVLERVLGFTAVNNNSVALDAKNSTLFYLAGYIPKIALLNSFYLIVTTFPPLLKAPLSWRKGSFREQLCFVVLFQLRCCWGILWNKYSVHCTKSSEEIFNVSGC